MKTLIDYMPFKVFFSGLAGSSTATFNFFMEELATIIDPM
jgi:hypothetical protein